MTLNELFKNTTYDDTLFSDEAKSAVSARIFMKAVRGSKVPYITCAIRDKEIKLTPEEAVRQLYIYKLMNEYGYAASRIQLETPIHFGREVKRADIAIMDKNRPMVPYIIVELKKPKLTDGKEQLKSYCNATGASIGVWTNGEQISCYNRKDPNFFEEISDIPKTLRISSRKPIPSVSHFPYFSFKLWCPCWSRRRRSAAEKIFHWGPSSFRFRCA